MTRLLASLAAIALTVLSLPARTALEVFADPGADAVVPLLPRNTRLDMADYFNSGIAHLSANVYDGPAIVTAADSLSVLFSPGESVACQLAVVPGSSDSLVVFIETVSLPQPDSRVALFSIPGWKPLPSSRAPLPVLDDWLTPDGRAARADVEAWLPFVVARAVYDPAAQAIVYTHSLASFFADPSDLSRLSRWMRPSVTAPRRGSSFVPR